MKRIHLMRKCIAVAVVVAVVSSLAMAQEEAEEKGWDTTVALGATLTSGNSDTLAANASIAASREGEKHEIRLGAEANYGEADFETTVDGTTTTSTETTTQNAKALANYKRKFGRIYGYSDDNILHDDLGGIDYRMTLGVGGGGYVIEGDNSKLGTEMGVAYIREELADNTENDGIFMRFAARHDHQFSDTARIWESVEYLPNTEDFGDYLVNAEAGAEAALNSTLSLRIVLQDRYDSTPPGDNDENDLSLVSSVVYKL